MDHQEKLLAEYEAAQACYLHYDSFRWQSGSLIVAGSFVFWGFVLQSKISESEIAMATANIVVTTLMTIWVLFAYHYRQLYLCKLQRVRFLEGELGFVQHRRFANGSDSRTKYNIRGPRGHILDLALYALTSLTGIVFYLPQMISQCFQECVPTFSTIGVVGVIIVTIWYVLRNDTKLRQELREMTESDEKESARIA